MGDITDFRGYNRGNLAELGHQRVQNVVGTSASCFMDENTMETIVTNVKQAELKANVGSILR